MSKPTLQAVIVQVEQLSQEEKEQLLAHLQKQQANKTSSPNMAMMRSKWMLGLIMNEAKK